jgi:hypothetical protein
MDDELFLTYANASLTENPEVICDILVDLLREGSDDKLEHCLINRDMGIFWEHFRNFISCNSLKEAETLFSQANFEDPREQDEFKQAFNAVYGYRDKYCPNCSRGFIKEHLLGEDPFRGKTNLKCHECGQLVFRKVLDGIIEGKKYSEIPGKNYLNYFRMLMNLAYEDVTYAVAINKGPDQSGDEVLRKRVIFIPNLLSDSSNERESIQNQLHKIVGYKV